MIVSKDVVSEMARFISSKDCQSIIFLTGAGVSVASGIPDFRSPGGMYDTLNPELITATPMQRKMMETDPTSVVYKDMFLQNSFPYMEVRRPFILGTQKQKWKATIAHRFMELLHEKTDKLTRIYTQNIDGLDHQCKKIPKEKIINVHGTLSEVACENCSEEMDFDDFCNKVSHNIKDIYGIDENAPSESTPIVCPSCGKATVKPKTVLFGSSLPSEFFDCSYEDIRKADLLIVAGTSLVVSPANSLVYRVNDDCKRFVVNMDAVGQELGLNFYGNDYGTINDRRDFFAKGPCEDIFLDLIDKLGWMEDLQGMSKQLPPASASLIQKRDDA